LPDRVARAQTVPFTFASLGENQLPSGRWSSLKLFFGEGEQECEVFLNLNPAIGKAEFSIKDSDYGDLLLAQFAKVL
jgi:hypothetical protein